MKGNFVMNTLFMVMDSFSVFGMVAIDAEFLNIENRDVILASS